MSIRLDLDPGKGEACRLERQGNVAQMRPRGAKNADSVLGRRARRRVGARFGAGAMRKDEQT